MCRQAESNDQWSTSNSVQQYSSEPRRRQALPRSALSVRPAFLASSRVKGRLVNAAGMQGDLVTPPSVPPGRELANRARKDHGIPHVWRQRALFHLLKNGRPASGT
jgi:hypothetical protein